MGGVEIPNQKYVEFSLQYIYGIGHTTAKAIIASTVGSDSEAERQRGVSGVWLVGVQGPRATACLFMLRMLL